MANEQEAAAELMLEQAIAVVNGYMPQEKCGCGACYSCAWIRLQEFIETMQSSAFCCPNCGSYLVGTTEGVEEQFLYGDVELTHTHPVRSCVSCGFAWTDMEHDYSQSEVVIQHLQETITELKQGLLDVIELGPRSSYATAARITLEHAGNCERSDKA